MHKCKISIDTNHNQICLFTSSNPSPASTSTLALQKSITFQPMTETKVNFEMPGPLTNVLVEPHKDLDPDLHLMDGITQSYTINGAHFLSVVIANFSHLPIIVNKKENVGTYTCLLYTSPSPRD